MVPHRQAEQRLFSVAVETIPCNLCGSTEAEVAITAQDFLLERPDAQVQFVKCDRCGLFYQNPRPTPEEMMSHYPSNYEPFDLHPDDERSSRLERIAVNYGLSKRRGLILRYRKSGRILDVGCATGLFLHVMNMDANWDAHGVEPNNYAATIAQERYGLNVHHGTLEQAQYPARSFDVVTLWDVLEHVHDPAATLDEIHRILKSDGLLILRVPNGISRDAGLFKETWAGWDPPRHLYVFTPDTLTKLLAKQGYAILDLRSRSGSYPTFVLSLRFWLSKRGASRKLKDLVAKTLYHPLMRLLSSPLFYLLGLGKRGALITLVAAKGEN